MTTYTEKWNGTPGGVGLTWTALFGSTDLNALAQGSSIISSAGAITNGTALDIFMDISYIAGGTVTTTGPGWLGFYLLPLLSNGLTYGDGNWGSATAGQPGGNYFLDNMEFTLYGAGTTLYGALTGLKMPPGSWKPVLYNGSTASLASTNICTYRTYNRGIS